MAFALAIVATGFAQKANVNKAKNKALAVEAPDFQGAKDAIEEALVNDETKGLANTWFVAGLVYEKAAEAEYNLWRATGNCNKIQMGEDILKAHKYYLESYGLDTLPDEKGKVKPKFTKKITTSMLNFYNNQYLVHYGIEKQGTEEWGEAINAFETHTSIVDLPLVSKVLVKDTAYYEIKYFTAQYAWKNENYQKAISIFEDIKDREYNSNGAYQSLCQLYFDAKDTIKYVATLEKGLEKFTSEFYYLASLINYYAFSGQLEMATELLEKAITKDPTNAQLYNARGEMLLKLEDLDNAIINFDKAIELKPDFKDAWYGKALSVYNKAVKIEQNAFNFGYGQEKLYDEEMAKAADVFKESIPFFEMVIKLDTEDFDTMKILKGLYYKFSESDPSYQTKYDEINKKMLGY